MKKEKKIICKTEYWFLRCNCERCKTQRDTWLRLAINKFVSEVVYKTLK